MTKSEKNPRRRKEAGGGGKRLSLASPSCTTNTINLGASTAISNAIMTSSASSYNNYSSTPPPSLSPIPHRLLVYPVCLLDIATIQRVCNFFIVHIGGVLVVFADYNLCADFEFSGMVLPLCFRDKCPNSLPATSTARFARFATDPLQSFLFSQITQPAFLKPLYFEVPRSSPSPLVGRAWLFREVTFVSIKSITSSIWI